MQRAVAQRVALLHLSPWGEVDLSGSEDVG